MLLIQLLTVEHVVIHIVSKDYIHGNLKDWIFKTSKNPFKIWKCETSILKERPTVLQNLFLLQIYTYV